MQKFKKIAYGAAASLIALAPSAALAVPNSWTSRGNPNAESAGLPGGSIYNIIASTLSWLLGILGFIAIIGFVIAGILYLTAAGNEAQIEKAKSAMMYSIMGVIVALVGYVIVRAVGSWLGESDSF